jgi:WD40 repeat protein
VVFRLTLIFISLVGVWQGSVSINRDQLTDSKKIVLRQTLSQEGEVDELAFSPDGRLLALALSKEKALKLYDSDTLQVKHRLMGTVRRFAFCPDSRLIAVSTSGDKVNIWDTDTGQLKTTLSGQPGVPFDLEFSRDCKRLLASGGGGTLTYDGKARLWDVESGQLIKVVKHKGFLFAGALVKSSFNPDGTTFVTSGAEDKTPKLWDAQNGALKAALEGHTKNVYHHGFSPNGQLVATASFDNTVKVWDGRSGSLKANLGGCYAYGFAFSPDERLLATACSDGNARLWNVLNKSVIATLKTTFMRATTADFSPNGQTLAVCHPDDNKCGLWDVATGQSIATLPAKDAYSVEFSPDSRLVVGLDNKNNIHVWNARSGELIITLNGARWPAVFSPDKRVLVTKGPKDAVLLWDLPPG